MDVPRSRDLQREPKEPWHDCLHSASPSIRMTAPPPTHTHFSFTPGASLRDKCSTWVGPFMVDGKRLVRPNSGPHLVRWRIPLGLLWRLRNGLSLCFEGMPGLSMGSCPGSNSGPSVFRSWRSGVEGKTLIFWACPVFTTPWVCSSLEERDVLPLGLLLCVWRHLREPSDEEDVGKDLEDEEEDEEEDEDDEEESCLLFFANDS